MLTLKPTLSPEPALLTRSPRVLSERRTVLGALRFTLLAIGGCSNSMDSEFLSQAKRCPGDYWHLNLESVEILSSKSDRGEDAEIALWPENALVATDALLLDIDEAYLVFANSAEVDTGPEDTGRQRNTLECQTP